MKSPLVTICIPVYGVENYIERCARSVFNQTYDNIEYIFVDDCGPDRSIEILKNVIVDYPNRKTNVWIINHEHNKGLAGARNTAIDNASGSFVLHVDSDDYIPSDYVSTILMKQQEGDYDIVVNKVVSVLYNKKKYNPFVAELEKETYLEKILARKINTQIVGKLVRRQLYIDNSIRNVEGINNSEDYQIYSQLVFFAKSIGYEEKAEYMYDISNESSYTNSHKEESEKQIFQSIDLLKHFFEVKAPQYLNFLDDAEFMVLTWNLKHWCYVQGHDEFFKCIKKRLFEFDESKLKELDLKSKIALYIDRRWILFINKIIKIF